MASLFQSITPRSGGVSTLDIASLEQSSQFFMILLMFIGAPGSTGGGIKVTTFAVLIGAVVTMIQENGMLFSIAIESPKPWFTVPLH